MFQGRSKVFQPVTRQHIPILWMYVCLWSEQQRVIHSDWKKFFPRFCISFLSKSSSRTRIGIDLEFIRREREFCPNYLGIVSFCNINTEKQAVDEIMRKTYTETYNFHDFCWIIQKFVFAIHQLSCCYLGKKFALFYAANLIYLFYLDEKLWAFKF